ncbi:MAG: hydrogenase maturation protease, partial [Candidatus Methanoperedens sp.]|nr:hydrogenase maturation protease [Candidatus Methanoperedens sp.]
TLNRKVVVIGVGNLLMGDDGIGIHAVEALRKEKLPSNVAVFSAETRAFDALEYMDGSDKAVIVDAYKKGGVPGSIYRFTFDPAGEIDESMNLSMHDINFVDALRAGRGIYKLPKEIVIIGVEPELLECRLGLSFKLNDAIPRIIEAVKSEL